MDHLANTDDLTSLNKRCKENFSESYLPIPLCCL